MKMNDLVGLLDKDKPLEGVEGAATESEGADKVGAKRKREGGEQVEGEYIGALPLMTFIEQDNRRESMWRDGIELLQLLSYTSIHDLHNCIVVHCIVVHVFFFLSFCQFHLFTYLTHDH